MPFDKSIEAIIREAMERGEFDDLPGKGKPIDLSAYKGRTPTRKQQKDIRTAVAEQIETQLAELLFTREQRKGEDSLLRRLLTL